MKKILTSRIFIFILGLVIAGSIGVYAAIKIQASEVGYKDGTVEDALDDLYSNVISKNMVTEEVYAGHNLSSGTTLTNIGSYKAYYVVIEETDSYSSIDHFKEQLNISSTNSSLVELGNAYRNPSGSTYRFAIGYMVFPDGSGEDIVITHNLVECMSVYGIKERNSSNE